MANHMASIKTPCVAKLVKDVDLFDYTVKCGTIVKVEQFDKIENEYQCRILEDNEQKVFWTTEDDLMVLTRKFRVEETVSVTRVYEIEAVNEDAAMDIMNSGEVWPENVDEDAEHAKVRITEIK